MFHVLAFLQDLVTVRTLIIRMETVEEPPSEGMMENVQPRGF
jgi:hypothetical protein